MTPPSVSGSFRDPNGFIFVEDGVLYRYVAPIYRAHYERLMTSGLYETLAGEGTLVRHGAVDPASVGHGDAYAVLQPEPIAFISYPYEWCFSQLKHAAMLTLDVQEAAIKRGMTLKDASAYNVQFRDGRPVFIDTLSFAIWEEGQPWEAYRQFCMHFLAPLALMAYTDVRLASLLRSYIDGVPLDLAAKLLPMRSKIRPTLMTHLHMHAKAEAKYADRTDVGEQTARKSMGKNAMLGLIDHLKGAIRGLSWTPEATEWGDYYDQTNYSAEARSAKLALVSSMIQSVHPSSVWDLGANTGVFSRIASGAGIPTVAFDIDPAAVEKNYLSIVSRDEANLLPLLLDLSNPSPAQGFEHNERASLMDRGPADLVLALALVHHLAIGNNVPLPRVAGMLARMGEHLIIEFVPKSDSQNQKLLATREDIFPDYNRRSFEEAFAGLFEIERREQIPQSTRMLYLMRRR